MPNRKTLNPGALQMIRRAAEIGLARSEYPAMEIGAAYRKWKEARGETATLLYGNQSSAAVALSKEAIALLRHRPCTRDGCQGQQYLEGVCAGCIEGQAGYKTKWTCKACLHRDLSKEDLNQWLLTLSSS